MTDNFVLQSSRHSKPNPILEVPMPSFARVLSPLFVSLLLPPVLFVAILYGWDLADRCLGYIEVSSFVRNHQAIVAKRLTDPKVHFFSLAHDPHSFGVLSIQFDVDDKATYELLESDLDEFWQLRFPPTWKTNLRSKEDLGKNYGFASLGLREVSEGIQRLQIAAVASICLQLIGLFSAPHWIRDRRKSKPMVDKILS
jgi:hypothetical protein